MGAVIVDENNRVLAASRNRVEKTNDVTMHAEIDCIRKASILKQNWRLNDCVLYTTLEPCPMCLGAIKASRIKRVIFGAYTIKNVIHPPQQISAFANGSEVVTRYHQEVSGNETDDYALEIVGGVLQDEASLMLKRFFQQRRFESENKK